MRNRNNGCDAGAKAKHLRRSFCRDKLAAGRGIQLRVARFHASRIRSVSFLMGGDRGGDKAM